MNTFDKNRPRWACRVARGWAAVGGRASASDHSPSLVELPSWTLGHVAGCPQCSRFFGASQALDRALAGDAQVGQPRVPEGLDRRIAMAVARSQQSPMPTRQRLRGATLAATAACAAAALVVAGLTLRTHSNSHGDAPAPLSAAEEAQLANQVVTLPSTLWESVKPSAAAAWKAEPLSREASDLASDARSAIGFLEANFLPVSDSNRPSKPAPST